MDTLKSKNRQYTAFAWGLLFLLLGALLVVPGDQNGLFLLGTGFIFLGLNLLRRLQGIPINLFSSVVGALALVGGLYATIRPVLSLPHFQIGFIPLVLILVGLYILIPGPKSSAA